MKALIIGAGGFIGSQVVVSASSVFDEVVSMGRDTQPGYLDLLDPQSIVTALRKERPDVIINCAGVIANDDSADLNSKMSENLLNAVIAAGLKLRSIVLLGSAAEYGVVEPCGALVSEDTPRNPTSKYGEAKAQEVDAVEAQARSVGLPVRIVRPFNPIGKGMPAHMLIPALMGQLKKDPQANIEVNRFDSVRDYIDARDLADAIVALAHVAEAPSTVYNVGTGTSESNKDVVVSLLQALGDNREFEQAAIELKDAPEPCYAARADISRIQSVTDWKPRYSLDDTIRELVNG